MFLNRSSYLLFIIAYSILFAGCRVIDWGKKTFYQGHKVNNCLFNPRQLIRSIRVYDQFETLGIFNALWINDEVISSYADIHGRKFELCEEEEERLFQDEVSKTDEYISFYILAYDPCESISPLYIPNKYENARWVVTLEVDGNIYEPHRIKIVTLEPEYRLLFGNYISKFKIPYLVQFLAKDDCNQPLIKPSTSCMALHFSSLKNKVYLIWKNLGCHY